MSGEEERAAQYAAAFRTGPHMSLEDAREQILTQVMAVADQEQADRRAELQRLWAVISANGDTNSRLMTERDKARTEVERLNAYRAAEIRTGNRLCEQLADARADIERLTAERDAAVAEANRLTGYDKWAAQDDPRPERVTRDLADALTTIARVKAWCDEVVRIGGHHVSVASIRAALETTGAGTGQEGTGNRHRAEETPDPVQEEPL